MWKTCAMDINELQVNDCYTMKFSKRVNGCHEDDFRVWTHERMPLNMQWLVLRIGGADFLHYWVTNSIWLECAGSLITK